MTSDGYRRGYVNFAHFCYIVKAPDIFLPGSGAKTKLKFGAGVSIHNLQIGDNNTMFIGGPSGDQRVPKTKSKSKKSRENVKLTGNRERLKC